MVSKIGLGIIVSSIAMVVVLLLETNGSITTPLTPFGANHWLPELATIFLVGIWLTNNVRKSEVVTIVFCLAIFPALTQALIFGTLGLINGIGTGMLFAGVILVGAWLGTETKRGKD